MTETDRNKRRVLTLLTHRGQLVYGVLVVELMQLAGHQGAGRMLAAVSVQAVKWYVHEGVHFVHCGAHLRSAECWKYSHVLKNLQ